MRVLTALVSIAFCLPVFGQQNVDVYKGQGHIMDGSGTIIRRDSRCEAGKADDCTRYRASDIESNVKGAGTLLGNTVGNPAEGGGRVMRVYVYENDAFPAGATALYDKKRRNLVVRRDWEAGDIYHEVAHGVIYDDLGTPDPTGADYGEAMSVHEGLAYIVEKMAGFDVEAPFVMTVDQALSFPGDGGYHQAGKLLAKMYGKFAAKTSDAIAKDVFLTARKNFEHVDDDTANASFVELLVNLNKAMPTEHLRALLEEFVAVGISLPFPTTVSRDEDLPPTPSTRTIAINPAPWWYDNPSTVRAMKSGAYVAPGVSGQTRPWLTPGQRRFPRGMAALVVRPIGLAH
ncbi:MAG: hypothetical protein OXQ90_14705 [Gammaproteobacteria bacterium]|nr:hypothetical protein [Gammaproteobacteria bacterium]